MDALERRAIFKYHLLVVGAHDFLTLYLFLEWWHLARSETLKHRDQGLVIHFRDEYVALDSPSTGLNNLKLFVADLSTVLVVRRKTFSYSVIGDKNDSAYTFNVCPGPRSN